MKITILILFSFLFCSCAINTLPKVAQKNNSENEDVSFSPTHINKDEIFKPQNLEEAHLEIDRGLSEHAKEILKKDRNELTEEEQNAYDHVLGHFGLGLWMRNNWNFWKGGKLSKYFNELGIYHPDNMSGIILKSYKAKLRGEKYSIEEDIEDYKSYMKSMETPKEGSPNDGAEIHWVITKGIGQGKGTIHLGISKSDNSFWRYEYGSEKGIEPARPNEIEDLKELMRYWKELNTTPDYIKNKS